MLKRQFKYAQSLSTLPALLAIGSFGQKKKHSFGQQTCIQAAQLPKYAAATTLSCNWQLAWGVGCGNSMRVCALR